MDLLVPPVRKHALFPSMIISIQRIKSGQPVVWNWQSATSVNGMYSKDLSAENTKCKSGSAKAGILRIPAATAFYGYQLDPKDKGANLIVERECP